MGQTVIGGCDLRDALAAAASVGCLIRRIRGTGELLVRHPSQLSAVRLNSRRKDAPRSIVAFIRRVQRAAR